MTKFNLAITGHRPDKLGGYNANPLSTAVYTRLKEVIRLTYHKYPDLVLITGGALGVDTVAAEYAKYVGIKYKLYAPCYEQEAKWRKPDQERYRIIKDHALEVKYTVLGPYQGKDCLFDRNKNMVNDSDGLLAVWNGSNSGTSHCVRYAQSLNKKVYIINPNKLEI
jgi:uncharacterized phage-like protein YoqJ